MLQKSKLRTTITLVAILMGLPSCGKDEGAATQPTTDTPQQPATQREVLTEADPTILQDTDGTYYLYGTGREADKGFLVYSSRDLQSWQGPVGTEGGFCLTAATAYGTAGFWAPQVVRHDGVYYMFYTANEQIAVAKATSPKGPFSQDTKQYITTPGKAIDPFVLFDTDGKVYLYHVRLDNGNRIFVSEMTDDLTAIKEETTRECISATEPWENTANAAWGVTEGPTVLHISDTYYMLYSANDYRNIDYAVGVATATSPFGPWTKSGQPIISRNNIGQYGTGHGDMLKDASGNWLYVLHTHNSLAEVQPRKTAIVGMIFGGDSFTAATDSFHYLYKAE